MTLNIKKHWKILFIFQAVHIYLIYSKHWVCIILNSLFSIYVLYIKIIVRQHLTLVNKVVTQTTTIFTFAWETSFLSFLLIRLTLFCSKYWQEMCFTVKHFFLYFFNIFSYYMPALSFTQKRLGGFFLFIFSEVVKACFPEWQISRTISWMTWQAFTQVDPGWRNLRRESKILGEIPFL